jgi:hypothetical protein
MTFHGIMVAANSASLILVAANSGSLILVVQVSFCSKITICCLASPVQGRAVPAVGLTGQGREHRPCALPHRGRRGRRGAMLIVMPASRALTFFVFFFFERTRHY